jgi:hypothetical protein
MAEKGPTPLGGNYDRRKLENGEASEERPNFRPLCYCKCPMCQRQNRLRSECSLGECLDEDVWVRFDQRSESGEAVAVPIGCARIVIGPWVLYGAMVA